MKCPVSPKRNSSLRMQKKDTQAIDIDFLNEEIEKFNHENHKSPDATPEKPPKSPKKNIAGNMFKRVSTAMGEINTDLLNDILFEDELHTNTESKPNTNILLKSPKRNTSMRILKKDLSSNLNGLKDLNDNFLNNNEFDDENFNLNPNQIKSSPKNKNISESKVKESNDTSSGSGKKGMVCPPSPKKNIPQKIKNKDNELDKKVNSNINELDDFDIILDNDIQPKSKTTNFSASPKDKNKSRTSGLDDITETLGDLELESNESTPSTRNKRKNLTDNSYKQESPRNAVIACPSSPKKGISSKIKNKTEAYMKDLNDISNTNTHSSQTQKEVKSAIITQCPQSPKRNTSTRIQQKDASALKNKIITKSSSSMLLDNDNFYTLDKPINSDDDDNVDNVEVIKKNSKNKMQEDSRQSDFYSLSGSSPNLQEKFNNLESKMKTIEQELKITKVTLDNKNKEFDRSLNEKHMLESKLILMEEKNHSLTNETK